MKYADWAHYGFWEWCIIAFGAVCMVCALWCMWVMFGIAVMLTAETFAEIVKFAGFNHEPWARFSNSLARWFTRMTPGL